MNRSCQPLKSIKFTYYSNRFEATRNDKNSVKRRSLSEHGVKSSLSLQFTCIFGIYFLVSSQYSHEFITLLSTMFQFTAGLNRISNPGLIHAHTKDTTESNIRSFLLFLFVGAFLYRIRSGQLKSSHQEITSVSLRS